MYASWTVSHCSSSSAAASGLTPGGSSIPRYEAKFGGSYVESRSAASEASFRSSSGSMLVISGSTRAPG